MVKRLNTADRILLSPCIDNCCLDEKDICLGCGRTLDEILNWRNLSEQEKTATIQDCQKRLAQQANNC